MVSGLVSEKAVHSRNLFQTFAVIETIEVTLDRGSPEPDEKNAVGGRDWGRVGAFESSQEQSGQSFQKLGRFDSERVCRRNDVYDRDSPFAPLDSINVVAMQIR